LGSGEPLAHQIPHDAGRVAIERRGGLVALLFVKAAGLDFERVQRDPAAAAPTPLRLRHRQEAAAEPAAAQLFGQEKAVYAELAEIAAAIEPADHLARCRVGDEHRERP